MADTYVDVRFKITDRCQWQCSFCHNEGNLATGDVRWSKSLGESLDALCRAIPINAIHLTGGEPTLCPSIEEITANLSTKGLAVKLTTNGQFDERMPDRLRAAGIGQMNFSLHSLNPQRFLHLQEGRGILWTENGKRGHQALQIIPDSSFKVVSQLEAARLDWAAQAIRRELDNILAAQACEIAVKINTVLSTGTDIFNAQEIIAWAREHKVGVRLLNDLSNPWQSELAILQLLEDMGAEHVERVVSPVSSSYSDRYRAPDGYEITFKRIRRLTLDQTACRLCPRKHNGTCEEGFYGIRLQMHHDTLYVVLCIQEINAETTMTVREFITSPQLQEIKELLAAP